MTNNDYTLLKETMVEVSNESCRKMDGRQIELTSSITNLVQTLCKVVKEVLVEVKQTPYSIVSLDQHGPSKERLVQE